ncbi:MAG: hypothetical protein A3B62_04570 [Rhodospirillales bacterium RIFCSPLOWO2_01_FULL_65_14]|nr:MAG: hypothetical protein A3B62_04570 [Rhodospirillales bacterium RIFCSPLOWO2_01_FULL_65_14]
MSFAEGLLLAYLKVGVLAAAVIAVVWLIGWGSVRLYRWEQDAAADAAPPKETTDARENSGTRPKMRPPGR